MFVPIIGSGLNIKNIDRIIDLHSQIPNYQDHQKLVIENIDTGKSPVCHFTFALEVTQKNHWNYTSALLSERGRPELKVTKLEDLEKKNSYPHKFCFLLEEALS